MQRHETVFLFHSYAGLHCVEVNGKSKSVGYEPGMQFESNTFRNTWNAVVINGDWRLVQCNWGARYGPLTCIKVVCSL